MVFGLAPLEVRRQIAMLGLIHRCVLGLGPSHFQKFFRPCSGQPQPYETRAIVRRHPRQLVDIRDGKLLEIQRRSALGMILDIQQVARRGGFREDCFLFPANGPRYCERTNSGRMHRLARDIVTKSQCCVSHFALVL